MKRIGAEVHYCYGIVVCRSRRVVIAHKCLNPNMGKKFSPLS
jgi:hypothetical protein